jgi:EpsD family peptidyl-prolyl cis-trans isomerase
MGFTSLRLLVLSAALIPLVACSGESESKATQVAAKVNGSEISVHEVNQVLQAARVAPSQVPVAKNQALARLIDQEIMVQQALDKKLDRSPAVMMQIEAAKREILQRAYMEQISGGVSKPTDSEISDYYNQHPELFSQRKVYAYSVLLVQADKATQPVVKDILANAKNMEEATATLKAKNIRFSINGETKPAEQIPMQLLPRLSQLKDGQVLSVASENGVEAVQLIQSKVVPKDATQARGDIEMFLVNQRKAALVQKEFEILKSKAKVEYLNDFHAVQKAPTAPSSSAPASTISGVTENGIAAGVK